MNRAHGKNCVGGDVRLAALAACLLAAALPAQAAVTISTHATQNMTCSGGVCQPTASSAVLNVSDLENLLAAGNTEVTTKGASVEANDIVIEAALSWSVGNNLSLDAQRAISIRKSVEATGSGGLILKAKTGAMGPELSFGRRGNVRFTSLSSSLTIDGAAYTLINTVEGLAAAIAGNSRGNYALAEDYDAAQDGTYTSSPISSDYYGSFDGLGNVISHLSVVARTDAALFTVLDKGAALRDLGLSNAHMRSGDVVAGLVLNSAGLIIHCFSSGAVRATGGRAAAGGLVMNNDSGVISDSYSTASVRGGGGNSVVGGLAGENYGQIANSFATGAVTQVGMSNIRQNPEAGGLVGESFGSIANSYATGSVTSGEAGSAGNLLGGLIGVNSGTVSSSYSTGEVVDEAQQDTYAGGLIGIDGAPSGSLSNTFWDTDTSGITDPNRGAGSPLDDPGITGLTTEQFQSGLPSGFDPKIWNEDSKLNEDFPYLINNPPPN